MQPVPTGYPIAEIVSDNLVSDNRGIEQCYFMSQLVSGPDLSFVKMYIQSIRSLTQEFRS